ncbi:alpha/beta hydrolase [Catenulispora subtropica]|uniref:Epoxide hydrolase n=1 Tax=Catenulispora subtropica TaxID=450798 RepID=A0ABN2RRY5_9ACTN
MTQRTRAQDPQIALSPGAHCPSVRRSSSLWPATIGSATSGQITQVQSTRPQTLGYGLNDSPAGLAAWILDKWRSWADSGGDLNATFGRDSLLTMLTIWWATESINSSTRDYYDNRWHGTEIGPTDRVRVPTAMAVFTESLVPEGEPPRSWYERLYEVRRWTVFPHGGHFVAAEVPDALAADVGEFFDGLTSVA